MGATNLDDILKLLPLLVQCRAELPEAGQETRVDNHGYSHMHGSGEGVVGTLASVHVVIGMNWSLGAQLSTKDFYSSEWGVGVEMRDTGIMSCDI